MRNTNKKGSANATERHDRTKWWFPREAGDVSVDKSNGRAKCDGKVLPPINNIS